MKHLFTRLIFIFLFCFSSAAQNNVTFQLDMNSVDPTTFTTPEVNGTFNSWCGSCASMTDIDGDNVWDIVIDLANGTYEFKFSADGWGIQETLFSGESCTNGNSQFTNRMLTVAGDTTLPVVCWGSCSSCSSGPPAYNVTFEVDMRGVTDPYNNPEVNGDFNSWCGNCWQMSDSDGDSIWDFSALFAAGDTIEWKYSADNWSIQEDLDSNLSCITINYDPSAPNGYGFVNRLSVISSDTTFSSPWNQCYVSSSVNGCTDPLAANYSPLATVDDGSCMAITSHTINTGNYYYDPNYLVINIGDTVTWINNGGFHDVNGNINSLTGLSFGNPVSFYLSPVSAAGIIGSYIFNVAGTYNYDCSIGNHASNGMVGTIIVNSPTLSQIDLPITWDDNTVDYTVTDFGGNSSSYSVDPLDPSNNVMMSDKTTGAQTWAGTTLGSPELLNSIPFVAGSTTISAYVYSPSSGIVVRMKAEDHTDPTKSVETEATTTVSNGWNTLVFDFSNEAQGTATIDYNYNYDMLSIFYDFGNNGQGDVYYLDTVVFGALYSGITGCTDSSANNYDPVATIDDGSCIYMICSDPVPTGLANNWVTDTKAEITWDNMNDSACMVFKYFVRYREVGTSTWTTKSAGVGNGLCNFGLNTTTKTLQNLTSGTTYEYKMKAFYCGGTQSNYSAPSQFTTADDCPPMTNLTATTFNGNQSKVRFDWDTTGAYVFARVALRVDTVGANWQTAGGFGVYYPSFTVNKFGLQSGESYRAQGRTFCDSNITSYRSWWTTPVFWTQPGTIRMSGGTTINNLDVYPNPTDDVFNVSFVSEEIQTLSIRILNIVGEVVYTENLEHFVGEYTKQISIGDNSRGVYFLETTDNQGTKTIKLVVR